MSIIGDLKFEETVPVVMADQSGHIIFVNQKFQEVFKWKFDEIVGLPLTIIIPPNLHDAHNLGFSRFLATEKSVILNLKLDLQAVNKDGEIFSAEHCIHAEKTHGVWTFAATIQPIDNKNAMKVNKEKADENDG